MSNAVENIVPAVSDPDLSIPTAMLSSGTAAPSTAPARAHRGGGRSRFLLVAGILLAAAFVRLKDIERDGLWQDEALSVSIAALPWGDVIPRVRHIEQIPPLYHFLLKGWMQLFGDSEVAVRMPSVLAGIASVWLLYRLAAPRLGWQAAAAGAALLALSPYQVDYSVEARPYALLVLTSLASSLLALRFMESGRPATGVAYAVVAAATVYSHLYGAFVLVAHGLVYAGAWVARRRRQRVRVDASSADTRFGPDAHDLVPPLCPPGRWVLAQLGALALFAPWVPTVHLWVTHVVRKFWIQPFGAAEIWRSIWAYAGSATAAGLVLVLAAVGAVWAWRRDVRLTALVVLLVILLVIVPVGISQFGRPVFTPRYGIAAGAALYLLAGAGIMTPRWPVVRLAVLVVVATIPLLKLDRTPARNGIQYEKPDWRTAGAYLRQNLAPGDVVALNNWFAETAYDYYIRRPDVELRVFETTELPVDPAAPPRRMWLLLHRGPDPYISPERWRATEGKAFGDIYVVRLEPVTEPTSTSRQ